MPIVSQSKGMHDSVEMHHQSCYHRERSDDAEAGRQVPSCENQHRLQRRKLLQLSQESER